jgi:hypothetical protein
MEGVSTSLLSEYLDRHLEKGFDFFVEHYFEGTPFLTDMLMTAHRYWRNSKSQVIRKALKLVVAYNLTLHVTMVEGLSEEESLTGKIDDDESMFHGKTMAPVMINFQVKCALADMWRELQKDILEELSALYSSVYSGEKLKNWPTIFMLAAILLAVWEEMQFDAHYRTPDEASVNKFCNDMETTPVGVIVGLFQAISQKLPTFLEWDTRKHHHLLNSNTAICDALTEVKEHVLKHGKLTRETNHVPGLYLSSHRKILAQPTGRRQVRPHQFRLLVKQIHLQTCYPRQLDCLPVTQFPSRYYGPITTTPPTARV